MFLGTYQHNLMDSGRLALPKKIRQELSGEKVILTIGFENCILGFAESNWHDTTKGELTRPLFSDREGRDLRRKMFAEAESVELDEQGRFVIPKDMITKVGIKSKVTVIGAGDHFEIWETQFWEEYKNSMKM